MKQILPLCVGMILLLGSCKKDQLTYSERRIVGDWTYTKVKFIDNWSISGDDYTEDFEDITLTFKSDFTAYSSNTKTGEEFTGVWELSEFNSDETNVDNLFVSLKNNLTGELEQLVFEDCSVTNRKLRSTYKSSDGLFRYILE